MKKTLCLVALLSLAGVATAQALQSAVIGASGSDIRLYNAATNSLTTLSMPGSATQASRGVMLASDRLYVSLWTTNGIGCYDFQTQTWTTVSDSSNGIMGAPYQPAPNWDNDGGFGVYCVDGNPPPTTLIPPPPLNMRNTFSVDYSKSPPTFAIDGYFSNVKVPMSDMYANPYGAGFLTVGFSSSDFEVAVYTSNGPQTTMTITPILPMLPLPSAYDSAVGEDGNLHVMTYNSLQNPAPNVVMQVDILTGAVSSIAVNGLMSSASVTPYCGMWMDPPERPGMLGYICSDVDDTIYTCDFATNPVVAVSTKPLATAAAVNTGRDAEEYQMVSWWDSAIAPGARTFEIFYPNASPGDSSVLVPSLSLPPKNPLKLGGGFEIYFGVDNATILGLQNVLPYTLVQTISTANKAVHVWKGFGSRLGIRSFWIAVATSGSRLVDVTNRINVAL